MSDEARANEIEEKHARYTRVFVVFQFCVIIETGVVFPAYLLGNLLPQGHPIQTLTWFAVHAGYSVIVILGLVFTSRLMNARDLLLGLRPGLRCLHCWYHTPAEEGEFTCAECGSRWDAGVVPTYLTPPVAQKLIPAPIEPGRSQTPVEWLLTPPLRRETLERESLIGSWREIKRGALLLLTTVLIGFPVVIVVFFSTPELMKAGTAAMAAPLMFGILMLSRAFKGYIRDRAEFARAEGALLCPKCLRPTSDESKKVVACDACDRRYRREDVESHYLKAANGWGMPRKLDDRAYRFDSDRPK